MDSDAGFVNAFIVQSALFKFEWMSIPCPPSVPTPPAGVLTITDVTHSTMRLNWDAAPGAVSKYMITYKPEEGDLKEVQLRFCLSLLAPVKDYRMI